MAETREWVFVSCETCGHWRNAELTKEEIADWLRTHCAAGLRSSQQRMVRQSTCPRPCGTTWEARTRGWHVGPNPFVSQTALRALPDQPVATRG